MLLDRANDKVWIAYANYLRAHGHPDGTIEQYITYPKRLCRDLGVSPWSVSTDLLMLWMAEFSWRPNTRKRAVGSLVNFYAWAVANGLTTAENVPTAVLKSIRVPAGVPRPCPDEVLEAAYRQATDDDERMQLRLLANTGLRRAELAAVERDHVEQHFGQPWLRVHGKGNRERLVPLPQDCADWLAARPRWAFPSKYGGHLTASAVGNRISALLGDGWTPHTLRHRYASIAYQRTGDIRAVQKLLGHQSISTTQIYVEVATSAMLAAAQGVWQDAA